MAAHPSAMDRPALVPLVVASFDLQLALPRGRIL